MLEWEKNIVYLAELIASNTNPIQAKLSKYGNL